MNSFESSQSQAPPDPNDPFGTWQSAPRTLVLESERRLVRFFLNAIEQRRVLTIQCSAPRQSGHAIRMRPERLSRVQGHPYVYLTGSCEPDSQQRILNLDANELRDYREICDWLHPTASNLFMRFSHGSERWHETGFRSKRTFLEWIEQLRP